MQILIIAPLHPPPPPHSSTHHRSFFKGLAKLYARKQRKRHNRFINHGLIPFNYMSFFCYPFFNEIIKANTREIIYNLH